MVRNRQKLERFCREIIKKENISYKKALSIYEALHKEAILLGAINHKTILDGLDIDIRIAKAVNGLSK